MCGHYITFKLRYIFPNHVHFYVRMKMCHDRVLTVYIYDIDEYEKMEPCKKDMQRMKHALN